VELLKQRLPRRVSLPWVCLALLAAACFAAEPPADILELQVKAAFLYNFAKFVEWPGPGANEESSFVFCVVGADPLYPILGQSLRGKMLNGRTLIARRLEKPSNAQHCNVVFVGSAESKHLAEVLEGAREFSVLTVGDSGQFADRGGMIQLIKDPNRFRFTINVDAVNRSGLRISSRLLQLAGRAPAAASSRSKP